MVKKEGKYTVNARVDVDYSKGKPKIKFSYPYKDKKKSAVKQGGLPYLLIVIWALISIVPFMIFFNGISNTIFYPESCGNVSWDIFESERNVSYLSSNNFSYNLTDVTKRVYGLNITCDNYTNIIKFETSGGYFSSIDSQQGDLSDLKLYFIFGWLYLAVLPAFFINRFITRRLVKKKWYQRWLPKAQANGILFKTKWKNYKNFKPKDLVGNCAVIPYFANVELDYKTHGDFSKQLQNIKIREYETQKRNINTGKKGKMKKDVFKWYAIFYFKDIPKNGYLEVTYT